MTLEDLRLEMNYRRAERLGMLAASGPVTDWMRVEADREVRAFADWAERHWVFDEDMPETTVGRTE